MTRSVLVTLFVLLPAIRQDVGVSAPERQDVKLLKSLADGLKQIRRDLDEQLRVVRYDQPSDFIPAATPPWPPEWILAHAGPQQKLWAAPADTLTSIWVDPVGRESGMTSVRFKHWSILSITTGYGRKKRGDPAPWPDVGAIGAERRLGGGRAARH